MTAAQVSTCMPDKQVSFCPKPAICWCLNKHNDRSCPIYAKWVAFHSYLPMGRNMVARVYSILFVALLLSGCTNIPFHSGAGTCAAPTADNVRVPTTEFVRANDENDDTQISSFLSWGPSPVVTDEHFVSYCPIWSDDLRRLPPVKCPDALLADEASGERRAQSLLKRSRRGTDIRCNGLIPTQWDDDVIQLIPTRWDASVILAGQG